MGTYAMATGYVSTHPSATGTVVHIVLGQLDVCSRVILTALPGQVQDGEVLHAGGIVF